MKKIVRAVSLMLLLTGFSGNAVADERGSIPRDGAIHGRVIDNEKQTLPGASIYIEDLKTGAAKASVDERQLSLFGEEDAA